jgi:hypothetical protein
MLGLIGVDQRQRRTAPTNSQKAMRAGVLVNGRPKRPETIETQRVIVDVKAAVRELTMDAMETLKNAMVDQRAPSSAKITAAIAALDRGWGKPEQAVSANVSVLIK